MIWVIFTLLAAFLWSVVNFIDKYTLSKWTKNPLVPTMVMGFVGVFAAFLIFLIRGVSPLSFANILLSLAMWAAYSLSGYFYFSSIKTEEVSRVVPLFSLSPLLTGIMAAVFLGEIFSSDKYIGVILLVLGAFLISQKRKFSLNFSTGLWFMMLAVALAASGNVMLKYLLGVTDFWTIYVYSRIGWLFALAPIIYMSFSDLSTMIKTYGKKSFIVMSTSQLINTIAGLVFFVAASFGFVTLVSALSQVQMLFVLFFGIILSIWLPKVLKEELTGKIVAQKLIAIALMFAGAILVT